MNLDCTPMIGQARLVEPGGSLWEERDTSLPHLTDDRMQVSSELPCAKSTGRLGTLPRLPQGQ